MSRALAGVLTLAAAVVSVSALLASTATATTLPETTHFYTVTLSDNKVVIKPNRSVKPGSRVGFTVRNTASHPRNFVFGSYNTGFIEPGRSKKFELNFLVPWSFVSISTEPHGAHKLGLRFICSW
jgi:plastocyanin